MTAPLKEAHIRAIICLLALPCILLPISNPDLFWHLASGNWILNHHAWPRSDVFSFTAAGKPWVDFEWLFQILIAGLYRYSGFWGLWFLKIILMAECAIALDAFLCLYDLSLNWRAAAFIFWSAGMMNYSDLRPDLFSMAFLALLFYILEKARKSSSAKEYGIVLALFALWVNLHAGFILGFGLIFLYAIFGLFLPGTFPRKKYWLLLLCAVAGTGLNPYGLGPYAVLYQHLQEGSKLSHIIIEWLPMNFHKPFHWPFAAQGIVFLFFLGFAASRKSLTKNFPWPAVLIALALSLDALLHARMAAYFGIAVIPALFIGVQNIKDTSRLSIFGIGSGFLAFYLAFLVWFIPKISWAFPYNSSHAPIQAALFLEKEKSFVTPLRIYNQWEWGGYLEWTLNPWYRVSSDGRYLFHEELYEAIQAEKNPPTWQAFLNKGGFNGLLTENREWTLPTLRRYPDGHTKPFQRPWYLSYMPRNQWALVYWDNQALFFIRRNAVSQNWLSTHEYRYVHPFDDAAFNEALARREIPLDKVQEEKNRHAQQILCPLK